MNVLLVSGYELGHQPLALAAPAGVLRERGHAVHCLDLSVDAWDPRAAEWADRVAFSVPMHTAARLARELTETIAAPVAWYGLYAAMGADIAESLGGRDPCGAVTTWIDGPQDRSAGALPARDLLPSLDRYARLLVGDESRTVGYAEASRGCSHRCRHCPVPVVYDGRIRINDADAVVADVAQQVERGAQHITFGDPDFFNGVHHSMRVVRAMSERFPDVTFDCTVKVEHIVRHAEMWPELADRGCLFVVSAFESTNDEILRRLDKGHTNSEASDAVGILRENAIEVRPSWLPFSPWGTLDDIRDMLEFVREHELVANVDPVQYTVRLLLPKGSLLLDDLDGIGPWDPVAQSYTWSSALDALQRELAALVERHVDAPVATVYDAVRLAVGLDAIAAEDARVVPRLSESWFCCAEPTGAQLASVTASVDGATSSRAALRAGSTQIQP